MIKDTIKNLSLSATLKINEKSKVIEILGFKIQRLLNCLDSKIKGC